MAREIAEETERQFILEVLSGNNITPFALYLRPFALERILEEDPAETMSSYILPGQMIIHPGRRFDFILQNHFDALDMMLISLGGPSEKEGAGRILTTDDSWEECFHRLAKRARTIIVVPGTQLGIMAEVRWLRVSGLLRKTVFFKPKEYLETEWRKVQELYEQKEYIHLPDYSQKQLSFRLYPSGEYHDLLTWEPVYRTSKRELGDAQMKAVLMNEPIPTDCE